MQNCVLVPRPFSENVESGKRSACALDSSTDYAGVGTEPWRIALLPSTMVVPRRKEQPENSQRFFKDGEIHSSFRNTDDMLDSEVLFE